MKKAVQMEMTVLLFLNVCSCTLNLKKNLWFPLIKNEQLLVSYFTFISLQIGLYQSV